MASCLSCPPDALSRIPSFLNSTPKFEALSLFGPCKNSKQLKQIHGKIIRYNLFPDQLLLTKLLRHYSSYGEIDYATSLFQQMQAPTTFAWNLMIRAHAINGNPRQALLFYNLLIISALPPDKFTFPFVLKACAVSSSINKGKEVHAFAIKAGYSKDMFLKNTLLDLYLKCGELEYARLVFDKMRVRSVVSWTIMLAGLIGCGKLDSARALFDEMPVRNVVSWTAMIDGYVVNRRPEEVFDLFWQMQAEGLRPNEFTLVSLLRACTELGSLKLGAWVHDYAVKNGFEVGVYLGTALIDMYSKCGSLREARQVFDKMGNKSLATWNSMIASLGVHGCGEEALVLFQRMRDENVQPDAITFVGVLCACVQTHHVDEGLSLFKYMTEYCGIVPVLEHYICMFQLWNRAKMLQRPDNNRGI
ncbi:hypothetical protein Nepgr_008696 [Nepenthes gracilis]|uniref:Pentatricopeptide repeat-containing protein n=1 Tax=Nepenthes gracilis TaxID=150966 RepID=A0AAD3XJP8_NEPGR|nr:hypothetical protein Nepgr_008696 [Nepenthes gracilis]